MDNVKKIIKELFVMIAATIVIALIFSALELVGLLAAELPLAMVDDDGTVITSVDGYYVTDRAVNFDVSSEVVGDGGILAYSVQKEGGREGAPIPVEGLRLRVEPRFNERLEFRFYVFGEDGECITALQGDGQFYGVAFEEAAGEIEALLKAEREREENGIIYVSGSEPELSVIPCGGAQTYILVKCLSEASNGTVYPADGPMDIRFSEGEYEVDVYSVDHSGSVSHAAGYPLRFVYDDTPPAYVSFTIDSEDGYFDPQREDCQLFSSDRVRVSMYSDDELSGIDRIEAECGEGPVDSNELTLASGIWRLSASAVDRCGNIGEKTEYDTTIMVENKSPVVTVDSYRDRDLVIADIAMRDCESGLYEAAVIWRGSEVRCERYGDEHCYIGERKLRVEIPFFSGEDAGELSVRVRDCAGNETCEVWDISEKDETVPRISFGGVRDGAVLSDSAGLTVRVDDNNIGPEGIIMTARRQGGVDTKEWQIPFGEELLFEEEGVYDISVSATDSAGNKAEKSIEFTVDKSAPVIRGLDKYEGSVLESFSLKEDIRSMFSDDTFVSYRLYINGRDHLEDDIVDEPGQYTVQVYAVDSAGNMAQDQARFVIAGEEKASMAAAEKVTGPEQMTAGKEEDVTRLPEMTESAGEGSEKIAVRATGKPGMFFYILFPAVLVIIIAVCYTLTRRQDRRMH